MFNNTDCLIFKQKIDKVILQSQLPPMVAYYIVKDSFNNLQKICEQVIEYQKNHNNEQKHTQNIDLLSEEDKEKMRQGMQVFSQFEEADQQES